MKTFYVLSAVGLALVVQAASAQSVTADPAEEVGTPKTRAEVIAELLEARRLGLTTFGEAPLKQATPEQEKQIAEAVRRAAEGSRYAGK